MSTDSAPTPPAADTVPALGHAPQAQAGHFDEWRGTPGQMAVATKSVAAHAMPTRAWGQFDTQIGLDGQGSLAQRQQRLRTSGDEVAADTPALLPLLLPANAWERLQTGALQWVALLERVLGDTYGANTLVQCGLLPAALVQGHPDYAHALHGVRPLQGSYLHAVGVDLARAPDGDWCVLGHSVQAPTGLGRMLAQRQAIAPVFRGAWAALGVQRLSASLRRWLQSLRAHSPAGERAHIALLTPGPYHSAYAEQIHLAHALGLSLVQGQDLVVRRERLFLNTLHGLVPVDGLIKWVDDAYCDPLELRTDSCLGIPGLVQVMRAGHLVMANLPATAFLESPALLAYLPALAPALLGQPLQLRVRPTAWGGDAAALQGSPWQGQEHTIRPSYPGSALHGDFAPLPGQRLDAWQRAHQLPAADYCVQAPLQLGQTPAWQDGAVQMRDYVLRVYALSDGPGRWRVVPGGVARVAHAPGVDAAALQHTGAGADVWVLAPHATPGPVVPEEPIAAAVTPNHVTSRTGENLFWLGRYAQRCACTARLALAVLDASDVDEGAPGAPLRGWLHALVLAHTLLPADTPAPLDTQLPWSVYAGQVQRHLRDTVQVTSVGFNVRAMRLAAAAVREQLGTAQWHMVEGLEAAFFAPATQPADALRAAIAALDHLGALESAAAVQDDGWQLLRLGRQVERGSFLAQAWLAARAHGVVPDVHSHQVLQTLLGTAAVGSVPAAWEQPLGAALGEAMALLAQGLQALSRPGSSAEALAPLLALLPLPSHSPVPLLADNAQALQAWVQACSQAAWRVGTGVAAHFFDHSGVRADTQGV